MLDELLKYNKIGSKDEISFVLYQALSSEEFKTKQDVKTICVLHSYNFGSSFNGIICLLELLNFIDVSGDVVRRSEIISSYNSVDLFDKGFFFEKLFAVLQSCDKLGTLFNHHSTKIDSQSLNYYIKENRIPFLFDPPPLEVNKEYPATLDLRQSWSKRNKGN